MALDKKALYAVLHILTATTRTYVFYFLNFNLLSVYECLPEHMYVHNVCPALIKTRRDFQSLWN